ncbi:MAG: ABC transporter ATP-binding protein [Alphaproteobacteria bacterium]|nr:MAG: ABC transporter ATP-binding protein [Alphaproteobacteria bacterium]
MPKAGKVDDSARRPMKRTSSGSRPGGTSSPSAVAPAPKIRRFGEYVAAYADFLGRARRWAILSLVTITITTGLRLVPPAAVGFVLDNILGQKPMPPTLIALLQALGFDGSPREVLAFVALVLIALALIGAALTTISGFNNHRLIHHLRERFRRRLFRHLAELPLYDMQHLRSGGATTLVSHDTTVAANLFSIAVHNPWAAVIQFAGTLAILTWLDWRLAVGCLIFVPLLLGAHRLWVSRLHSKWRRVREAYAELDGHATETFAGLRVIRSFGGERRETRRYVQKHHRIIDQEMDVWRNTQVVQIAWVLLIPCAIAILLWYGGGRVLGDAAIAETGTAAANLLTAGDLVMFLIYLALLLQPVSVVAGTMTAVQNGLASFDRVLDLLDRPTMRELSPGRLKIDGDAVVGQVTLDKVSFVYPGSDRFALRGVSMEVPAGQSVALVGASGAGKTTMFNLIGRFYLPTAGRILLDGQDIAEINSDSYRKLIGVVDQDVFLFSGTIAENIAYARPGATMTEVREAAAGAGALGFIEEFDNGFDTPVGERGIFLSGGQKQRIAIARTLIIDSRILLLDEPTSELDPATEAELRSRIAPLLHGRTVFIIAHRLSTILMADRIVVLDNGQVVGDGTHDELLATNQAYRDLMQLAPLADEAPKRH